MTERRHCHGAVGFMTLKRFKVTLAWLLLVLGWIAPAWGEDVAGRVNADALGGGRTDFLRAERALKQGDQAALAALRDRLRD